MKRAKLMVMVIALLAAGLAAFMAWSLMRPAPKVVAEKKTDTVKVLVAKNAISFGDSFRAADFSWQAWPKEAANETYITETSRPNAATEYTGAIARASFLAGEPIKMAKIAKPGEGGVMAAILPAGMRAVATKITEETAAGNFILPGDRVDVMVTKKQRNPNGRTDDQVTETLFRNIRVLAIGQELDQKDSKKVSTGKTATLELTSSQAEALAQNGAAGEIALSLRSIEDAVKAKTASTEEDTPKKEHVSGIKVLRYGVWSRTYGLQ